MANLTSGNAALFGHGGPRASKAYASTGATLPIGIMHALPLELDYGDSSGRHVLLEANLTAAAVAEGAAAVTASPISTPTAVTLTPADFLIVVGVNSQAQIRAVKENGPIELSKEAAIYAAALYMADDSLVGWANELTGITAVGGTPGATPTLQSVFDNAETVREALDDSGLVVTTVMDGTGLQGLRTDINTNGAAAFANVATSEIISRLIGDSRSMISSADGFFMAPDGKSLIIVEPSYNLLDVVAGDKVGCSFISWIEEIRGLPGVTFTSDKQTGKGTQITPTFGMVTPPEVASASFGQAMGATRMPSPSGDLAIMPRSYDGTDGWAIDVRGSAGIETLLDASASRFVYLQ